MLLWTQVLLEFKEYAQEVDVDFVRKVRPGGGIKLLISSALLIIVLGHP